MEIDIWRYLKIGMFENDTINENITDAEEHGDVWAMEDIIYWYSHLLIIPFVAAFGLYGNYHSCGALFVC